MHAYAPIRTGSTGRNSLLLLAFSVIWLTSAFAQPPQRQSPEEYIEHYKDLAIAEMYRAGIPASITIAQGILESGSGNSRLAREGNNHFGIKCHKGWEGETIHEDDDALNECFRKYPTAYDSYIDHSEFLMTRERYAFLFEYDRTDYEQWAHGLKKAGYATNPKYAPLLISLIERYNLQQLDVAPPVEIEQDPILADQEDTKDPKEHKKRQKKLPTGIFETNRIKTVYMQPGQTLPYIAKQQEVRLKRLERYNDVDEGYVLEPGMKVFLQPKRNKAANKYHKVGEGETLYAISQIYGIKMKRLLKYNLLEEGQEVAVGQRLYLRQKRNHPPKLRREDYTPASEVLATKETKKPDPKAEEPKPEPAEQAEEVAQVEVPDPQPETGSEDGAKPEQKEVTEQVDEMEETNKAAEEKPAYTYVPAGDSQQISGSQIDDPMNDDLIDYRDPEPATEKTEPMQTESKPEQDTVDFIYYEVQQGDTLYSLSRKHGTSVQKLQEWNDLGEATIHIGQRLIVGVGNSM